MSSGFFGEYFPEEEIFTPPSGKKTRRETRESIWETPSESEPHRRLSSTKDTPTGRSKKYQAKRRRDKVLIISDTEEEESLDLSPENSPKAGRNGEGKTEILGDYDEIELPSFYDISDSSLELGSKEEITTTPLSLKQTSEFTETAPQETDPSDSTIATETIKTDTAVAPNPETGEKLKEKEKEEEEEEGEGNGSETVFEETKSATKEPGGEGETSQESTSPESQESSKTETTFSVEEESDEDTFTDPGLTEEEWIERTRNLPNQIRDTEIIEGDQTEVKWTDRSPLKGSEKYAKFLLQYGYVVIPYLTEQESKNLLQRIEGDWKSAPDMPKFFKERGFSGLDETHKLVFNEQGELGSITSYYSEIILRVVDDIRDQYLSNFILALMDHSSNPFFRDIPGRFVARPGRRQARRGYVRKILKDTSRHQFKGWVTLSEEQSFDFIEDTRYHHKEYRKNYERITWKRDSPQMGKSLPLPLKDARNQSLPQKTIRVPIGSILIHFTHLQHLESVGQNNLLIQLPFNFAISKSIDTNDTKFAREQQKRWERFEVPYTMEGMPPRQRLVTTEMFESAISKVASLSEEFPDETCEHLFFGDPEDDSDTTKYRALKMYAKPFDENYWKGTSFPDMDMEYKPMFLGAPGVLRCSYKKKYYLPHGRTSSGEEDSDTVSSSEL